MTLLGDPAVRGRARETTLHVACTRLVGAVEEQSGNAEATFPPQNSRLQWQSVAGGI